MLYYELVLGEHYRKCASIVSHCGKLIIIAEIVRIPCITNKDLPAMVFEFMCKAVLSAL